MTRQEAIRLFQTTIKCIDPITNKQTRVTDWNIAQLVEMSQLAINALEKQVPQKPVNDEINDIPRLCPRCRSWELENDISEHFEYCPHCGQAIKEDE